MRKNTTVNNINVTLFREEIGRLLFKDIQKKTQKIFNKGTLRAAERLI